MNLWTDPAPAPPRLDCVRYVSSFEELLQAPFSGKVNAVCWRRRLEGDFDAVQAALGEIDEITSLEDEDLLGLELGPAGTRARDQLLLDLRRLREAGLEPSLDCIPAYPKSSAGAWVPVDVYDFHADSATVPTDTFLCGYTVAASEGIGNEEAVRYIDLPEIRAGLLRDYGGADDATFAAHLKEQFYDLHYQMREGASVYSFGLGNMWRIATLCPDSPVPPCIHRAPTTPEGSAPRLLLIS